MQEILKRLEIFKQEFGKRMVNKQQQKTKKYHFVYNFCADICLRKKNYYYLCTTKHVAL